MLNPMALFIDVVLIRLPSLVQAPSTGRYDLPPAPPSTVARVAGSRYRQEAAEGDRPAEGPTFPKLRERARWPLRRLALDRE
jgi:hypothetical protein